LYRTLPYSLTQSQLIDFNPATPVPVVDQRPIFSPDGTYLVTGGLGGVGLRLLAYLSHINFICALPFDIYSYLYLNGVRNLLLTDYDVSRRRSVEWVKQATQVGSDINIVIKYADVAKYLNIPLYASAF
jgi:hypothetical protein